jgi:hypothetical protein
MVSGGASLMTRRDEPAWHGETGHGRSRAEGALPPRVHHAVACQGPATAAAAAVRPRGVQCACAGERRGGAHHSAMRPRHCTSSAPSGARPSSRSTGPHGAICMEPRCRRRASRPSMARWGAGRGPCAWAGPAGRGLCACGPGVQAQAREKEALHERAMGGAPGCPRTGGKHNPVRVRGLRAEPVG